MSHKTSYLHDLLGLSRLAIDGVHGVTDVVKAVHMQVLQKALGAPLGVPLGKPFVAPVVGVSNLVYRSVHGVSHLVGASVQQVLRPLIPLFGEQTDNAARGALVSALNGVLGDHLASSQNPLAITMQLRRNGLPLILEKDALSEALPLATGRVLIVAHGLCMNDKQWLRNGVDHGALLEQQRGYTSVYLHYNSGRHIAQNGAQLAGLLQTLYENWPVPITEIAILGHSMGGLVARSACIVAQQNGDAWLKQLRKIVFLGTPHQGAPLERGGNWLTRLLDMNGYSAPFARLAKIRSAGITDLRHARLDALVPEDRFSSAHTATPAVPLPQGVACYAIAATLGEQAGDLADTFLAGDGLVPLASALGQHEDATRSSGFAEAQQKIVYRCNHMQLLDAPEVTQQLLAWM